MKKKLLILLLIHALALSALGCSKQQALSSGVSTSTEVLVQQEETTTPEEVSTEETDTADTPEESDEPEVESEPPAESETPEETPEESQEEESPLSAALHQILTEAQTSAAPIEEALQNTSASQSEQEEQAKALYALWDKALNDLWKVLQQNLDTDAMQTLTAEERNWISTKDSAIEQAVSSDQSGLSQNAASNRAAAQLTQARVEELVAQYADADALA